MNPDSLVTVDMTVFDYDDLLDLLLTCVEEFARYSELGDLVADFRFYYDLLKSNRRKL